MSKTLGQVASEAYEEATKERRDGFTMPWDAVSPYGQAGWQAAAEEVARAAVAEVQTQVSNLHPERYEAVIEAAKAWALETTTEPLTPCESNLAKALRALDSEEA